MIHSLIVQVSRNHRRMSFVLRGPARLVATDFKSDGQWYSEPSDEDRRSLGLPTSYTDPDVVTGTDKMFDIELPVGTEAVRIKTEGEVRIRSLWFDGDRTETDVLDRAREWLDRQEPEVMKRSGHDLIADLVDECERLRAHTRGASESENERECLLEEIDRLHGLLAAARSERESCDRLARQYLAKAEQYERDWVAAKYELGVTLGKLRTRCERLEAALRDVIAVAEDRERFVVNIARAALAETEETDDARKESRVYIPNKPPPGDRQWKAQTSGRDLSSASRGRWRGEDDG